MRFLLLAFSLCISLGLNAQRDVRIYQDVQLFNQGVVSENVLGVLQNSRSQNIHIDIPGEGFGLSLHKVEILSEEFFVETSDGQIITNIDGTFYQGKIDDKPNSVATMSMYKGSVFCSYSNEDGNFEVSGEKSKPYRIRQIPAQRNVPFECYTQDTPSRNDSPDSPSGACRAVQIYFEADYKLYQDKGSSVTNTVNYVTALFNQVAMLYSNEQITVQISQLKVWNTPDPYIPYTNTASALTAFKNSVGFNFNGNLAHLLSSRSLGGGIAYVDVLCVKEYAFGVSAITTSFQNVPTYSWSVEVVTHELGHNFGSWHTHSCNWPGGALDNCASTEGGCPPGPPPVNGGTIMSYCHLTGYGINFANGFGIVPGNHIRNKYNSASCLSGTGSAPTGLQTVSITNTTATFKWLPVTGTLSYSVQYKKVSDVNWITVSVGLNTSYTAANLTSNTQYHWKVKTDCSNYTTPLTFTTTGQGGCNTILVPNVTNITQTSALISWASLAGVNFYHLQYKTITANNWIEIGFIPTNSLALSNLAPSTTYMVKVRPDCNPNFGTVVQFTTLSGGGTCQPPNNLVNDMITANSVRLAWSPQSFATGYTIGLKLSNQSQWFTLGPINYNIVILSGLQPSTTYDWKVKNQCSDWSYVMTFTTPSNLTDQPNNDPYPNPTSGLFKFDNVFGKGLLFNSSGLEVGEFDLDGTCVDITNMARGVYFLKVNGKIFKIVKI